MIKTDLVTEKEGFAWKGHSPMEPRGQSESSKAATAPSAGFRAHCLLQISPPASINSLAQTTEWGLLAAGTAHGLVMLDCVRKAAVYSKCTLNAQGMAERKASNYYN